MHPALVRSQIMNLVHNDLLHRTENLASTLRGEQDVERFGSGHEKIRRLPQHGGARALRSISGADSDRKLRPRLFHGFRRIRKLARKTGQMMMDVIVERLERCYVQNTNPAGMRFHRQLLDGDPVQAWQNRRQRLPRAGRSSDERMGLAPNRRPSPALYICRLPDPFSEPFLRHRVKPESTFSNCPHTISPH